MIESLLGGASVRTVQTYRGEPVPSEPGAIAGLIVMGGPQAVYEQDRYPYLREELRLIERTLAAGKPILGVCLGSQLLAAALGAAVKPGQQAEMGWQPVKLTEDDPMFAGIPRQFMGLHWHGDVFDLPSGATSLATSAGTAHQAFVHGGRAYGLLFHLEMTAPQLAGMVQEFGADPGIVAAADRYLPSLQKIGQRVFGYWASLAGLPGRAVAAKVSST